MIKIFPSLISGDILNLNKQIQELEPFCSGFHIDVMDFHFVPNLTWGPQFVNEIRKVATKQLHVHLMVDYPEKYLDRLSLSAGDIVSVHIESPSDLSIEELLNLIASYGYTPSLALNPFTSIEAVVGLRTPLQHVLLMSVNPGFSGQQFMGHVLDKARALTAFKQAHNLNFTIAMDGGITRKLVHALADAGVSEIGVASAIFNEPNPLQSLKHFLD